MKRLVPYLLFALFALSNVAATVAQEKGDTIALNGKKYKLLSDNKISNPGFEEGFTNWTDGTTTAAELTSAKFTLTKTGGVDNSQYLVGTTNEGSAGEGSIGTGWAIEAGKTYCFFYHVKYQDNTVAAGSEQYLKVSLTNNKTASTEPKVIIAATQVSSGGKWTQNVVEFTNSGPSYSYIVARFRWLSSRFGFDNFGLYEVFEVADISGLQETVATAQALYTAGSNGATEFQAAIATAQSFLTDASPAEVLKAIADLEKAITTYKYAIASPDKPLDMTSFITNPGFDDNNGSGWTGAGTVNYHEVEFYELLFDMHQTISGLPAGKYRMTAQGFERPKANDSGSAYKGGKETISACFYAKATNFSERNTPFKSLYSHTYSGTGSSNGYVNTMAAAETSFKTAGNYEATVTDILLNEGGTLTIGAKTDFKQTGYWTLFDNFRLEYLGAYDINDLVAASNDRITEAQSLLTKKITNAATEGLNAGITQVQQALGITPLVLDQVNAAKVVLDEAITLANASITAYASLQTAIAEANVTMTYLEKQDKITKLETALSTAKSIYDDLDQTVAQITKAATDLKTTAKSVDKQIYIASWSMGDVNNADNAWNYSRSKQSKNFILFWEKGYNTEDPDKLVCGNYKPSVTQILANAEIAFKFYSDSLKFVKKGSSKTDNYKMVIRLRYEPTEWEASGSGVDNTIGLLTLTPWAAPSRNWQTLYHEVGHCFQYQVHCDNGDQNGWMYGFGDNASGGCGWWEQCAQWQAYKIMPGEQFTNEWVSGYLNNVHKHPLHEGPRYENFYIQDYWSSLHGVDIIGRLWNQSKKPEDPIETYKRITGITQEKFNDEMYDCAARFASWDIPAIKSYGASKIASRPQPAMTNAGDNYWMISASVCPENYGHNIIQVNVPKSGGTVMAFFEGKAGADGFRKINTSYAGWRYGFVAMKSDGTRVYSDMSSASMKVDGGKGTATFECPANCSRLWFVVSGAPSTHWRHPWDDNVTNDEQWPYQVKFGNTNKLGSANIPLPTDVIPTFAENIQLISVDNTLTIYGIPSNSMIQINAVSGQILLNEAVSEDTFSTTLPAGIYTVTIQTEEGTYNQKVMIQ